MNVLVFQDTRCMITDEWNYFNNLYGKHSLPGLDIFKWRLNKKMVRLPLL